MSLIPTINHFQDPEVGKIGGQLDTYLNMELPETSTILITLVLAFFIIKSIFFTERGPIPETSGNVYKIASPAELQTLLSSSKHVAVDFYADWCPPCRAIAPIFSKLADEYGGPSSDDADAKGGRHFAFAKVNVDHVKEVAQKYGISAMPTFMFFTDGVPYGQKIRGADKVNLESVVKALAADGVEK
ncbi:thioredoxin-like protein [Xylariaceae sp. FL0255]|nr:thioredoxin-like protein [Xylariaceae sp. FL0255]